MELASYWNDIRKVVSTAQKSSMHCTLATVDKNGMPNITPIGTVFLRDDCSAYFFDCYTSKMSENLERNPNVCLSAVNTQTTFWLKSLIFGRFSTAPGVRLYGKVGALREATSAETSAVNKRTAPFSWTKGSELIWSSFTHVRDITFTDFRPVQYPKMMEHLWQ